ncbi:NAD-dependent epimerase/dehydratase family protein [Paenibacillus cisolokensis]|uniref:NAD-dependent epimerase/dehydratase family protein n=1 Tax=Paenibacillus cisolokensis TaxID=1658519 RepID=UPI003D2D27CC
MKILVTGGAGFIGSHIVDALLMHGHKVVVIDNLSTGKKENVNRDAVFLHMDINSSQIKGVFKEHKPDVVIHHAAQVSVSYSMKNPLMDQELNIRGTQNILNCCIESGTGKFIYASSAAVYGMPKFLPIPEEHPIKPESFYGISKYVPEEYIRIFSKFYGLDYTILRYANVYGPRQDHLGEGGVISIFINQILRGETPTIFGDGEQTRDFIYVQDVVNANLAALTLGSKKTLNISTNQTTSLNNLVRIMAELTGKDISPIYLEKRPGDILESCLNNTSAIKELRWAPMYPLEEGLKDTISYYLGELVDLTH